MSRRQTHTAAVESAQVLVRALGLDDGTRGGDGGSREQRADLRAVGGVRPQTHQGGHEAEVDFGDVSVRLAST